MARIADVYKERKNIASPSLPSSSPFFLSPLFLSFHDLIALPPFYFPPSPLLPFISRFFRLSPGRSQGFAMKRGKSKTDAPQKADSKLAVRKGAERASKKPKKAKAVKDPNKPKRPASAFFVFMEEFRKTFKEKHPNNKSVAAVGKAGGDKWKSLSEDEKAPYVAKAAKLKTEYAKKLAAYDKNQSGGGSRTAEEDESDKSKSEVNDDEDDEEESEEEEEDDE